MVLLAAILLSIIVALIRGGRLDRLAGVSFRHGWVALLALGLQVAIVYAVEPGSRPSAWLLIGSHVLLIFVIAVNRNIPGLPIVGLGLGLNLLVMLVNGGFMPVTPEALAQAGLSHRAQGLSAGDHVLGAKDVLLPRDNTRLWILSDIFAVPLPVIRTVFSLGDLVLALGAFILFQRAMGAAPGRPGTTAKAKG